MELSRTKTQTKCSFLLAKLAQNEVVTTSLDSDYVKRLSYVMGRNYSNARFAQTEISPRTVGILARDFGEISQYHQGAGEDATFVSNSTNIAKQHIVTY